MRKDIVVGATLGLVAVALATAGPVAAAPSGQTSAEQTIQELQNEGYRVIQSRVGSGPLESCTVKAVRQGRSITDLVGAPRGNTEERVRYTTVYVDLKCG